MLWLCGICPLLADSFVVHTYPQPGLHRAISQVNAQPWLESIQPAASAEFFGFDYDKASVQQYKFDYIAHLERSSRQQLSLSAELQNWFTQHPIIREQFWLSLSPTHDDMAQCIAIFDNLRRLFPERMEEYYQLAIATAVVWDQPDAIISSRNIGIWGYEAEQFSKPASYSEIFDYYSNSRHQDSFVFSPKSLPWQALVHVVDQDLSVNEMEWAVQQFQAERYDMRSLYNKVPYDESKLSTGNAALHKKSYDLKNLIRYGGLCGDRATFLTRVAKAFAIPAMKMRIEAAGTSWGHVWAGHLLDNMNEARLAHTGKSSACVQQCGWAYDPQTRTLVREDKMSMVLMAAMMRHAALMDAQFLAQRAAENFHSNPPLSLELSLAAIGACNASPLGWHMLNHHTATGQFPFDHALKLFKACGKWRQNYPNMAAEYLNCMIHAMPDDLSENQWACLAEYLHDENVSTEQSISLLHTLLAKTHNPTMAHDAMALVARICKHPSTSTLLTSPLLQESLHIAQAYDLQNELAPLLKNLSQALQQHNSLVPEWLVAQSSQAKPREL